MLWLVSCDEEKMVRCEMVARVCDCHFYLVFYMSVEQTSERTAQHDSQEAGLCSVLETVTWPLVKRKLSRLGIASPENVLLAHGALGYDITERPVPLKEDFITYILLWGGWEGVGAYDAGPRREHRFWSGGRRGPWEGLGQSLS